MFTCMEFLRLLCDLQRSEGNKNVLYVFVCFLTFTPVAPSLPGGPSDPGLPWRQTEQMSEIWSWYGCIIYIGGIWTSLQIYFWVRWIQSSFALFLSCMCFFTSRPVSPAGPVNPGGPTGPGGPRSPEEPDAPCLPGSPWGTNH